MAARYVRTNRKKSVGRPIDNKSSKQKELYIYGNTVRELQVEEDPYIERKVKKQRQINHQRKKDQEYALLMNKGYAVFMVAAAVVAFGFVLRFQFLSSSLMNDRDKMTTLKNETISLKEENDDYERRIERSVDISEIQRIAMDELGMVYPDDSHIVKYDYEENDYVRQYSEVPQE